MDDGVNKSIFFVYFCLISSLKRLKHDFKVPNLFEYIIYNKNLIKYKYTPLSQNVFILLN